MQPVEKIEKILEMIVCPACRGPLKYDTLKEASRSVRCTTCGISYPVEDGIPVLLVSRAANQDQ